MDKNEDWHKKVNGPKQGCRIRCDKAKKDRSKEGDKKALRYDKDRTK